MNIKQQLSTRHNLKANNVQTQEDLELTLSRQSSKRLNKSNPYPYSSSPDKNISWGGGGLLTRRGSPDKISSGGGGPLRRLLPPEKEEVSWQGRALITRRSHEGGFLLRRSPSPEEEAVSLEGGSLCRRWQYPDKEEVSWQERGLLTRKRFLRRGWSPD